MLGASLLVVALTNGVLALRSRDEPGPDDAPGVGRDTVRAA